MTKGLLSVVRHLINIPIMIVSWFVFFIPIDLTFWLSSILAVSVYIGSNFTIKKIQQHSIMKNYQLSPSEYYHIQAQIKEASNKVRALNSHYLKVRSISAFKQLFELSRLAKRIISLVKSNPKKFYQAESFFYAHLDSAVELTTKYTFLVSQPTKDRNIKIALQDTRDTLESLNGVLEDDLKNVLSSDIEHLQMELDFAKLSVSKKEPLYLKGESDDERKEYKR